MIVATRRLEGRRIQVIDDDGYTAEISLAEWSRVLRTPQGQQRALVERIVRERERESTE